MVISFPDQPTTSCGRNGEFKSTGLTVQPVTAHDEAAKHEFWIQALTSRGGAASGYFAVPVAQMPALIDGLQKMLHEYHRGQDSAYGYEPVIELPNQSNGRLIAALPCGREVHIRRAADNAGTVVEVLAGPNAEEIVHELTLADADNAEPGEDGKFQCRTCEEREESLTKGQCLTCFFLK